MFGKLESISKKRASHSVSLIWDAEALKFYHIKDKERVYVNDTTLACKVIYRKPVSKEFKDRLRKDGVNLNIVKEWDKRVVSLIDHERALIIDKDWSCYKPGKNNLILR